MCNSSLDSAKFAPVSSADFAVLVGIDWADRKHDVHWITRDGRHGHRVIEHSAEAVEELVAWLHQLAGGGGVAVALERSRGALQYALMFREGLTLYPVDPKQFASYRKSFSSGGAKCDRTDAALLARMLAERADQLRASRPDDERTRRLAHLCQARRALVDEATRLKQQLQSLLKMFFPLLLELAHVESPLLAEVLRRWGDPREFRRVHPKTLAGLFRRHVTKNEDRLRELVNHVRQSLVLVTDRAVIEATAVRAAATARELPQVLEAIRDLEGRIDQAMAAHPDAQLFRQLPGAGRALAPRLLAAFGSDRGRYATADEVAVVSGIAPVMKASGNSRLVVRRMACSAYLKQTFHEFANHARKWCPWSRAYYRWQRSRNVAHNAAVRKLASRWIRILFRIWQSRVPYQPSRYLNRLHASNHPCLSFLDET